MPLNALTASVTTGIQGRRFATAISGQTAGSTIDISADGAPGFSFVNGILSSTSLPYPVSTAVLRETLAGEVVRETRIAITAVTREQLAAQAAASVGGGRSVRSTRTAATRQADGSLVYALLVEDDLGATASLTPGGPTPTLTLTGPLSFTAGAASGTLVANIGNVPAGSTPTLTPGDGRLAITGDQASGWKVVVGSTASAAGTIALSVAAPGANGASADVTVSAAITQLLMGSRFVQMGYNGYPGSDGTDTDGNSRITSFNETGATVTKLRAYFANWLANATNERDGYNDIIVRASVEYPAGTFTPLTFGGASSVTIPPTGTGNLAESDEATLATAVPSGAQYWIRTFVSVAAGGKWPQGYQIFATGYNALGEAADFSTGVDKTTGGTITNATATFNRQGYGPVAVKATAFTGTTVAKAYAAVGDSLVMGATDVYEGSASADGRGNIGYFAKAAASRYPVINLGISGTSAQNNVPANFTRRAALLSKIGVTHIYCDWSVNDVIAGRTAAQIAGNVSSIAGGFKTAVPGAKVIWATTTPRTTSTDAWKTAANQAPSASPTGAFTGGASSVRSAFNQLLRAGISGVDIVFEAADQIEVNASNVLTRDGGLWISGNGGVGATSTHLTTTGATSDAASNDGLHPTTFNIALPGLGGVYILRDAVRAVFGGW